MQICFHLSRKGIINGKKVILNKKLKKHQYSSILTYRSSPYGFTPYGRFSVSHKRGQTTKIIYKYFSNLLKRVKNK